MKKLYLCIIALLAATNMNIKADILDAGKYFHVVDRAISAGYDYIEFRYADAETGIGNNDDAFINVEIGITLEDDTKILLSSIPWRNENMVRHNKEYGLIQFISAEDLKDPKRSITTMRFYPSGLSFRRIKSMWIRGRWDIDDNDPDSPGSKDYDIDESRPVINGNKNEMLDAGMTSARFYRYKSRKILFTNYDGWGCEEGYTRHIRFMKENSYIAPPIYGTTEGHFNPENNHEEFEYELQGEFQDNKEYTIYFYSYLTREIMVPNGTKGKEGESDKLVQEFHDYIYSTKTQACRYPRNAKAVKDGLTMRTMLKWDIMNSDQPTTPSSFDGAFRIFRIENRTKETVEIGSTTAGEFIESDVVPDLDAEYTYEIVYFLNGWNSKTDYSNDLKTIVKIASINSGFWDGSGTKEHPYEISNAYELCALSGYTNCGGNQYLNKHDKTTLKWIQTANIDLNDELSLRRNPNFIPIGNDTHSFKGQYDGQGFTIDNLIMDRPSEDKKGLFGLVTGTDLAPTSLPVIENIRITNALIKAGSHLGTLVSRAIDNVTIRNCNIHTYIKSHNKENGYCGGLAGMLENGCKVENSCVSGDILTHSLYNGGFIGSINNCTISDCYSAINVQSNPEISYEINSNAFVGQSIESTFNNCHYDNTKGNNTTPIPGSETINGISKVTDVSGTALTAQLGIGNWNYVCGQLPIQKIFDADNMFDVTLSTKQNVNEIIADVPNADVKFEYDYKYKWNTIMLPFDIPKAQQSQWGRFFEYVKYNPERNYALFKQVSDVKANTPYLYEHKDGGGIGYYYENGITLNSTSGVTDATIPPTNDGLTGTYFNIQAPTGGYILNMKKEVDITKGETGYFQKATQKDYVAPMSAYYWKSGISKPIVFIKCIDEDGKPTSVESIDIDEGQPEETIIYNLQGIRIPEPVKGLNIINGKKVLVR